MSVQETAAADSPVLAAIYGGSNAEHLIVNGGGTYPHDSVGNPWLGAYVTASGNLLADFHLNATAEMMGRLQVARLWHMTDDPGVKEMLRFNLARDHMHQMQWLRAIEELEADGLGGVPVPDAFPFEDEEQQFAYNYMNCSDGDKAGEGRWARGPAMDRSGRDLEYTERPEPHGERPVLQPGDPRLFGTPPAAGGTPT